MCACGRLKNVNRYEGRSGGDECSGLQNSCSWRGGGQGEGVKDVEDAVNRVPTELAGMAVWRDKSREHPQNDKLCYPATCCQSIAKMLSANSSPMRSWASTVAAPT